LDGWAERTGERITFNKEARARFLNFALSSEALWKGNFRDLNAAVARMATLANGGRITVEVVEEEIERLQYSWGGDALASAAPALATILTAEQLAAVDVFDRLQLEQVIAICRRCRSLSEAGRTLFNRSRAQRSSTNDADRLRKYLARFELNWDSIVHSAEQTSQST
jgi:transcriptional regulatory protein RtcR